MISIGKLATNKCATLQGLKYGAISQNDYGSDIQIDVNNIQSDLNSFDYNRTLNNDNCFALKFESLENPKADFYYLVTLKKLKCIDLYLIRRTVIK